MEVVLKREDANDWIYRGEGAVNLVLTYNGSSPQFVGKILRIQKVERNGSMCENDGPALTMHECLLWEKTGALLSAPTKEIALQLYAHHVMSPILGSEHIDAGIRISVSKNFLEAVANNVDSKRPPWRVDAARINPLCGSALLISDHAIFPCGILKEEFCISVEIKPKCGFLPLSEFIAERNGIKRSVTRFRMHQALKFRQGKISQISEYDPLDMFSGSKERVRRAISALFITPQNNFRVFLNGSQIFGGLGGNADTTNQMVSEAFEDKLKGIILADDGMRTRTFLDLVADAVISSGSLDRLLQAQKLDAVDIEGAIHAYYDVVSQPCVVCSDLGEGTLLDRYTSLHSVPTSESLNIVRDYLIAATAKDLSMMISFRPRENGDSASTYATAILESTNQSFDYKVSFIDLDMKPLKRMEYYYELDQQIVSSYCQIQKNEFQLDNTIKPDETLP